MSTISEQGRVIQQQASQPDQNRRITQHIEQRIRPGESMSTTSEQVRVNEHHIRAGESHLATGESMSTKSEQANH